MQQPPAKRRENAPRVLKVIAQRELHLPIGAESAHRVNGRETPSEEGWRCQTCGRVGELRRVENVKELRAEFDFLLLGEPELLKKGEVKVECSGSPQDVPAR